tara:strand:- start:1971 stop:2567 length:597 start_codon:yes stop_codon:yes gene_type:complete
MSIQEASESINLFEGPIPGQSMTADPNSQMAWDGAAEYTTIKEATEAVFLDLLEEENLLNVINLMNQGTSIAGVTQMLLVVGYSKGKWNPDLMLMLAEPIMYILLAIAEKFGIKDVTLYEGEELDIDESEDLSSEEMQKVSRDSLESIIGKVKLNTEAKQTIEDSPAIKKLADLDVESLLAQREQPIEEEPESLLAQR